MIHEITIYGCDCDGHNCEEFWQDSETGSIGHVDIDVQKEEVTNDDWHIADDGKTYCPDCHHMGDDDKITVNDGSTDWIKPDLR
ncbi:MAG TPA: hypothetical protein VK541_05095 [Pedobacter sp.]|uniref:hypothetical protein n=1 Tax=Pedobacter sp. TaxID=1411316 RepID=UPI002D079C31|nr:hypothetical protein [Pedobacter sp.]HMI01836.1 hypothetical protein [Pedobacter sp.]